MLRDQVFDFDDRYVILICFNTKISLQRTNQTKPVCLNDVTWCISKNKRGNLVAIVVVVASNDQVGRFEVYGAAHNEFMVTSRFFVSVDIIHVNVMYGNYMN